jgi:hypothetical protein
MFFKTKFNTLQTTGMLQQVQTIETAILIEI